MRHLAAPPQQDFSVYVARPETTFCELEPTDQPEALYAQGYLPYSGANQLQGVFYSARSARVVLPAFTLSSENRRIARKFDGTFTKARIPAAVFTPDAHFWDLCLGYFSHKHGPNAMPRARLETILANPLASEVVVYTKDAVPVAYVLEVAAGSMGHYWFSFYNLAYARQSLGLWLMLDCIRDAQTRGLAHYYLGTVYGPHALYKTNFDPLEWWDGQRWSSDVAELKRQSREER